MNSVMQLYSKPRLGVGFELFANRNKYLYREDGPMSQRNIFFNFSHHSLTYFSEKCGLKLRPYQVKMGVKFTPDSSSLFLKGEH